MHQVIRTVKVEGIDISTTEAPGTPSEISKEASPAYLQDPEYPSRIILERLQYYMEVLLQSGIDLCARRSRLGTPPIPKNSLVWEDYLDSIEDEWEQKQTLRQARSDEVVQSERREAALGRVEDAFVPLTLVKFLGEVSRGAQNIQKGIEASDTDNGAPDPRYQLYVHDLLSMHLMQRWLHRLLVDTVYPGLPSLWELEAACVLLIVILPRLHRLAGEAEDQKRKDREVCAAPTRAVKMEGSPAQSESAPSTPKKQTTIPVTRAAAKWTTEQPTYHDVQPLPAAASPQRLDAPADHWIHLTPSKARRYSMSLPPVPTAETEGGPAATPTEESNGTSTLTGAAYGELDLLSADLSAAEVVQYCMARLRQIRTVADIHHDSKEWIQVSRLLRIPLWVFSPAPA